MGKPTEAIEHIIEANTLLSGLGFESGGLGMCHAISNTFTFFPECHGMFHGEKVAYGCLVELEPYEFDTQMIFNAIREVDRHGRELKERLAARGQ